MTDKLEETEELIVRFKVHPGVGGVGSWRHGTLIEMISSVPYLFLSENSTVPSISTINDLLSSGGRDAGMSGGVEWKPFEITQPQYDHLVLELLTLPDANYKVSPDDEHDLDYPQWVDLTLKQAREEAAQDWDGPVLQLFFHFAEQGHYGAFVRANGSTPFWVPASAESDALGDLARCAIDIASSRNSQCSWLARSGVSHFGFTSSGDDVSFELRHSSTDAPENSPGLLWVSATAPTLSFVDAILRCVENTREKYSDEQYRQKSGKFRFPNRELVELRVVMESV